MIDWLMSLPEWVRGGLSIIGALTCGFIYVLTVWHGFLKKM